MVFDSCSLKVWWLLIPDRESRKSFVEVKSDKKQQPTSRRSQEASNDVRTCLRIVLQGSNQMSGPAERNHITVNEVSDMQTKFQRTNLMPSIPGRSRNSILHKEEQSTECRRLGPMVV